MPERKVKPLPVEAIALIRSGVALFSVADIVCELVENSIDARAQTILVSVDPSSLSTFSSACSDSNIFVRVEDDGHGIIYDDLEKVGTRYSTSKLNCESTSISCALSLVKTYGYRGEALASLAECSVLDIRTRHTSSSFTLSKIFRHGVCASIGRASLRQPRPGTTITVRDLFYNLPVRRKNLQSKSHMEVEKIRKALVALALANPGVSITLKNGSTGEVLLQTNSTFLKQTAIFSQIFGNKKAQFLRPVDGASTGFRVNGFISIEGHSNKDLQYVFVNKRPIMKTKIQKLLNNLFSESSLVQSGKGYLSKKSSSINQSGNNGVKWPFYILYITCDPSVIDFSLEPSKSSIEIENWNTINELLSSVIRDFLNKYALCSLKLDAFELLILANTKIKDSENISREKEKNSNSHTIVSRELSTNPQSFNPLTSTRNFNISKSTGPLETTDLILISDKILPTPSGPKLTNTQIFQGKKIKKKRHADVDINVIGSFVELDENRSKYITQSNKRRCVNNVDIPNSSIRHTISKDPLRIQERGGEITKISFLHHSMTDIYEKNITEIQNTHREEFDSNIEQSNRNKEKINEGPRVIDVTSSISKTLVGKSNKHINESNGDDSFSTNFFGRTNSNSSLTEKNGKNFEMSSVSRKECLTFTRKKTIASPYSQKSTISKTASKYCSIYCDTHSKWRSTAEENKLYQIATSTKDSLARLMENWNTTVFTLTNQKVLSMGDERKSNQKNMKSYKTSRPFKFSRDMFSRLDVLNQVDKKFIICNIRGQGNSSNVLIAVDQHAAHERVRLEYLIDRYWPILQYRSKKTIPSSLLSEPMKIKISPQILEGAKLFRSELKRRGLNFSIPTPVCQFEKTINIHTLPNVFLKNFNDVSSVTIMPRDIIGFIEEIVENLRQTGGGDTMSMPRMICYILNSKACRGAIMFGDELSHKQCVSLLQKLSKCRLPFQCAHGRPCMVPLLNTKCLKSSDKFFTRKMKFVLNVPEALPSRTVRSY